MKKPIAFPLVAASMLIALPSSASEAAGVCVSPVRVKAGDRGLVLPPPGSPGFGALPGRQYIVQVDSGTRAAVQERTGTFLPIDAPKKKHIFKVYRDGKIVHSFWFALSEKGLDKCVVFNPTYESWSIIEAAAASKCGCK